MSSLSLAQRLVQGNYCMSQSHVQSDQLSSESKHAMVIVFIAKTKYNNSYCDYFLMP